MKYSTYSLCTLALGLALATGAEAQGSHCRGLDQQRCSASAACKWVPERQPAMGVSKRKGHCRLDVKAAGELAKKAQQQR